MSTQREPRLGYVPHFDATTLDGRRIRYQDIWQHQNLVLVIGDPHDREAVAHYALQLHAREAEFDREQTTVVITTDSVPTLPAPTVLVADRWGEILYLSTLAGQPSSFPDADELLSWVHFAESQCPECPP